MLTSQYVLIFVWLGIWAFICWKADATQDEYVFGVREKRMYWLVAFLIFLPVIILASTRSSSIGDTGTYRQTFGEMPDTIGGFFAYIRSVKKDPGFYGFACLIKVLIGNHNIIYTSIIAIIQGVILLSVYRKYSSSYVTSIFLFLASTDYIAWMCNGIRQFMAVMILFIGTRFYVERKYVRAVIIILIAALFHQSALLMLPFILIAQGKAWNMRTIAFMILALIAVVFVDKFTTLLDDSLVNTQYANVVSDYTSWNDDGTNPLRVAVYSVPAILSIIGLRFIRSEGTVFTNFCVNMSIISMGLYIVSMVTSGIFIGRLPIYCSLYSYMLLPWELDHFFTKGSRSLVFIIMILAYFIFYYYQMHMTYGLF